MTDAHAFVCPLQATSNSQIPQTFTLPNTMYNAPAYAGGYMYIQPTASPVLAYQVSSDLLCACMWRDQTVSNVHLPASLRTDRVLLNPPACRYQTWPFCGLPCG